MANSRPVYMARQPIYDRNLEVFGYELLFRRAEQGFAGDVSDAESAQAICNALVVPSASHFYVNIFSSKNTNCLRQKPTVQTLFCS